MKMDEIINSHGDTFVNSEIRESGKDPLKKGSEVGTSADLIDVSSCSEEAMEDISRPLAHDVEGDGFGD